MMIAACIALAIIAGAQFFLIIKFNTRLDVLEMLMNSIMNKITANDYIEAKKKAPGANRHPRTLQQKLEASMKRKQWWEKKRAAETQVQQPDIKENLNG